MNASQTPASPEELKVLDQYFVAALQGVLASPYFIGRAEVTPGDVHAYIVQQSFEFAREGLRRRRDFYPQKD